MIIRFVKNYLANIISDLELILEEYDGSDEDNIVFEKLLELLRDIYKKFPEAFSERELSSLKRLKDEMDKHRENGTKMGILPFKQGYYYRDRIQKYKVINLTLNSAKIIYDNGNTEILNEEDIKIKSKIYSNIISDSGSRYLVKKLLNAKLNAQRLISRIPNLERVSHCYFCVHPVDASCALCYVCGWYVCKK